MICLLIMNFFEIFFLLANNNKMGGTRIDYILYFKILYDTINFQDFFHFVYDNFEQFITIH